VPGGLDAPHTPSTTWSIDQTRATTAPQARLLVVDNEPTIRRLLAAALPLAGFEVHTATDGLGALRVARQVDPDLLVMDLTLPGMDGFTVTRQLRRSGQRVPVLFLTARDTTQDKVTGLTVGGDDYLTKPFSLDELVARIRAILRRTRSSADLTANVLAYADLELDQDTREVTRAGRHLDLSPTEFTLLQYLMRNRGRVLSKTQILEHVWQCEWERSPNVVETYISYLRRKVDNVTNKDGSTVLPLIHTRRGVGYVLLQKPS
jgi:two-component system OmpR family response regulator